jgi:hypothetical protein
MSADLDTFDLAWSRYDRDPVKNQHKLDDALKYMGDLRDLADVLIRNMQELKSGKTASVTARREQARFEEGKPADPTENMSEEDAKEWEDMNEEHGDKFKKASVENLNRNASIVEKTLSRVAATGRKIDQLEAAGKRFDSVRAREDLSRIASELRELVASTDLAQPYVTTEVQKIAGQASKIADLFSV